MKKVLLIAALVALASPALAGGIEQDVQKYDTACSNFLASNDIPRIAPGYASFKSICLKGAPSDPEFVATWLSQPETFMIAMHACESELNRRPRMTQIPAAYGMYSAVGEAGSCMTAELQLR